MRKKILALLLAGAMMSPAVMNVQAAENTDYIAAEAAVATADEPVSEVAEISTDDAEITIASVPSAPANNAPLTSLPSYEGNAYTVINDNEPGFSQEDRTCTEAFEMYSDLDELGRCGTAYASICPEIEPTEERGDISSVHPSGWQSGMGWQRCHLIGFQLAGENANISNLITGSAYFNVSGMLPFENMVDDYVDETGNHVLYRVTPYFEGDNLIASGVQMEAWSVEDQGDGICFNVYVFNVSPGKVIDYKTGTVTSAEPEASTITLKSKSATYTGKTINVDKAVVSGSTGKVTYTYYTNSACTKKATSHYKPGTYYVKASVAADANYKAATSSAVKLVIKKRSQSITGGKYTKGYTWNSSKSRYFYIAAKSTTSRTYKKLSGNSKLSVTSSGKVVLKAGAKAGTYVIRVKITAKATDCTYGTSIVKKVIVRVKKNHAVATPTPAPAAPSVVYWTPSGSVYHKSSSCPTLSRSKTIYSGSIAASGKGRACSVCS